MLKVKSIKVNNLPNVKVAVNGQSASMTGGSYSAPSDPFKSSTNSAEKEDAWMKKNESAKADQRKEDSKWWGLDVTDSAKAVGLSKSSPVSQSLTKDKSLTWKNEETSEGWRLVARRDGKIAATVKQKMEGGKVTGADTKRFISGDGPEKEDAWMKKNESAKADQRKEDSKWWGLDVTDSAKAVGLSKSSPVSQSLTKDKSLTWKNEETSEGWRLVARRDGKIAATVKQKMEGGKVTGADTIRYT